MHHEFRFTDIGEGLEEGEIVAWLVGVGERVARDQPIVEVLTDKSNAELPSPCDGVVVALGGDVGDVVHVGHVLAVIDDEAGAGTAGDAEPGATFFQQAAQVEQGAGSTARLPAPPSSAAGAPMPTPRIKAAPSTRREAARRGIDLATVTGTGPGGRILLSDLDDRAEPSPPLMGSPDLAAEEAPTPTDDAPVVRVLTSPADSPVTEDSSIEPPRSGASTPEAALPKTPPAPKAGGRQLPLRGLRRAVARNMAQSWTEIPHIHVIEEIDAEPLLELRQQLRTSSVSAFERLTPLSLFVAAVARAMRRHPMANASLDLTNDQIIEHNPVDVGVAVAASHGLVVPVLRHADRLSLDEVTTGVTQLVDGARSGGLSPTAYRDGTVTVTNFGSLGASAALPLIRPPESVIFGFGAVARRPWVHQDAVVPRETMHIVIGTDHRLLDGDVTTSLLLDVCEQLSAPATLLLPPGT